MLIKGNYSTRQIFIDGVELLPDRSQKMRNHSPDGFNWGYGGSGPAQLAMAILLVFTEEVTAMRLYQKFKWDVIANLPVKNFSLDGKVIEQWLEGK